MDISRLADLLKNKASSALEDYSQLADAYPNLKNFAGALVGNVERNVPTQAELQNPEAMQQRALGYMSPMAGTVKALRLYHGGTESVPKIKREGVFDAIFASPDKEAALSHGDVLSKYFVNKNKIGENFSEKGDEAVNLIRQYYPDASADDVDNILYPIIAEDSPAWNFDNSDILRLTGQPDMGEASWTLQADRGRIGKQLGYDAVTTQDEHGISYMIPFGSKAKYRK